MSTMKPPPAGLAERGRAYWQAVVTDYDLTPSELAILIEACRTLDNLDQLAAAIARDGVMVLGSAGQSVTNPALTEVRGQRLALHRLVSALALPDVDGATVPTSGTLRAKRAPRSAGRVTARTSGRWPGYGRLTGRCRRRTNCHPYWPPGRALRAGFPTRNSRRQRRTCPINGEPGRRSAAGKARSTPGR